MFHFNQLQISICIMIISEWSHFQIQWHCHLECQSRREEQQLCFQIRPDGEQTEDQRWSVDIENRRFVQQERSVAEEECWIFFQSQWCCRQKCYTGKEQPRTCYQDGSTGKEGCQFDDQTCFTWEWLWCSV